MDKFGIFNLLNSFLSFSSSAKPQNEKESPPENSQGASNILSTLTNLLNKNNGGFTPNAPAPAPEKSIKPETPPAPLQSKMLYTMNSHDDFIKRVKEKNK